MALAWILPSLLAAIGFFVVSRLLRPRRTTPKLQLARLAVGGLLAANALVLVSAVTLVVTATPSSAQEEGAAQTEERDSGSAHRDYAAAAAIGIATISAGVAVAVTGSAAIGGMTQNPEIFGRSLVLVGLAEGIAIYGLIVAFMILTG